MRTLKNFENHSWGFFIYEKWDPCLGISCKNDPKLWHIPVCLNMRVPSRAAPNSTKIYHAYYSLYTSWMVFSRPQEYTSRLLLTGYVGLILPSTTVVSTSQSNVEHPLQLLLWSSFSGSVTVIEYPHSTLKGTAVCSSSHSEESGCVRKYLLNKQTIWWDGVLTPWDESLSPFFITKVACPPGTRLANTSLKYLDTCLKVSWMASYLRCSNTLIRSVIAYRQRKEHHNLIFRLSHFLELMYHQLSCKARLK